MEKHDISSRQDVETLVSSFYAKVRKHEALGPFFNKTITDWDDHIQTLSNFWETNLFFVKAYKGNPLRKHIAVDNAFDGGIEQAHFGNWLELWFRTIDELFEGRNAHLAKERARGMANIIFMRIFQARQGAQKKSSAMSKVYSLRFIAALIWIGFLLAISFMEAPLKFQAPSVTLSIGLEIGRIVFATLNKVEWLLFLVILLSFVLESATKHSKLLLGLLATILGFQTIYLLPALDQRALTIISGIDPEPSNEHFFYVTMEVMKLIILSITTYGFIFKQQNYESTNKHDLTR